ncbi:hypothetical protein HY636_03935 [Candidatus Woesearchaeota archaeon]|nr:hypothetical protein [Candidatus Woesearchaeota archaeon]
MGTIGHTLGIVGRGRAVDNLFRAIAEGAIQLEGIEEIVFYNHTKENYPSDKQEIDTDFLKKALSKTPLKKSGDTRTAEHILGYNKIQPSVNDNFRSFYRDSNVIFFAPALDLYESQFQDITDAIIDDFIVADGTGKYERYRRDNGKTYKEKTALLSCEMLYEIMVDVSKSHGGIDAHKDFLAKAYEVGKFKSLEAKNSEEKELEKKITVEALSIIFQMKREGRLPYGYRIWGCFAPSLKMIIDYAKLFRQTMHEPKNDPKPILVLTNEMSMVCNILAMFNPRLTPFLVGVSDYDVKRSKELFVKHFGLKHLLTDETFNMAFNNIGVIGDHESYALPVFPKGFLEEHKINPKDAHAFFKNELYSYVSDKISKDEDHNKSVRDSLINVINAATRSLGSCLRFEGDFYNGVFIPLKRNLDRKGFSYSLEIEESVEQKRLTLDENTGIFATYHHSFCNGRSIPLEVEMPEYVQQQFLNCLTDYATLLHRLITNPVIGEHLVEPVENKKICCFPYVETQARK